MQITDVKVRKLFDEGPMKAVVSVTFDSQLAVHDIKVINARDRFFIVMPSRKNPDDTYRDIVHPINAQFRAAMEDTARHFLLNGHGDYLDVCRDMFALIERNVHNRRTKTK